MTSRKRCGVGGRSIDPSNLHLRDQIRKTARAEKNPSATWRSPVDSVRALTKHHYREIGGDSMFSLSGQFSEIPLKVRSVNECSCSKGVCENANERSVFLCNWKSKKLESEMSKLICEDDAEDSDGEERSSATQDDEHSVGKSDLHLSERYHPGAFTCKDMNSTASITCINKNKSKRGDISRTGFSRCNENLRREIMNRFGENAVHGSPVSLIDMSHDLRKEAAVSPLLAGLGNKGWARSPILRSHRNVSAAESWGASTGSFDDADDEVDDRLGLPGCGVPCYWSRKSTPKSRVWYGSCCSPTLSNALRRKGSQPVRRRRHHWSNNRRPNYRIAVRRSSVRSGESNFEMYSSSSFDGRRRSTNYRSRGGLELVAINSDKHEESSPENFRSISCKYRPMFFGELIGQNVIVQSLSNAVARGRIAPVYLFQGPRGTGKTSMARIFSAALNCLSTEMIKPCGVCRECFDFVSGKSKRLIEVDCSDEKVIDSIKNLLAHPPAISLFQVFVINECHLLPPKTWLMFLGILEKPVANVIIVLTTTDINNVPRTVLSRCQKHVFNKISSGDIVTRLGKIAAAENLDLEPGALDLIAMNANGSLRDAETVLDQLSLFGKRINTQLVNELVGFVSNEKLLDLLALAMSSDMAETVIRARELMNSGVDPIALMSQMAGLIVDIIAGTDRKCDSIFNGRCLSERELDRLKHALVHLSEAAKHMKGSSDHSTWFTATLLQLGFDQSQLQNVSEADQESDIPEKRVESIIHQQRLATAWMQGTPVSLNCSKPERNQILPQDNTCPSNDLQSRNSMDDLEDELNHELNALKLNNGTKSYKERTAKRINRSPLSPSLLHCSFASNFSKENMGYESGSGAPCCSGMFCWNNGKPGEKGTKADRCVRKRGRFSWF